MASPAAAEPAAHDIKPSEKKALIELRVILQDTVAPSNRLAPPLTPNRKRTIRVANSGPDPDLARDDLSDATMWGVPLLPRKRHESTDGVLLRFIRASECRPAEALEMIRRTLAWRREHDVDSMADGEAEEAGFSGAAVASGVGREGHPVSYSATYGAFKDRVLYRKPLASEEMREKFMRSRIQLMERGIRELSLRPGGVSSMIQVIDLKDSSICSMKELRRIITKFCLVDDNYPEFVEQNIFINVSFRYYAYKAVLSRDLSQRTRNRFIFARPSRVTETLLRFIPAENIPVQYGGFQRDYESEFTENERVASEMSVKGGSSTTVEFPVTEPGVTVVWDVAVVGWDVHYTEEFIPDDEGSYKVLIRKERRLEEVARDSFYISEPGKVVLTVTNRTIRKKKILYRWKSKPTVPSYQLDLAPRS